MNRPALRSAIADPTIATSRLSLRAISMRPVRMSSQVPCSAWVLLPRTCASACHDVRSISTWNDGKGIATSGTNSER